MRVVTRLKTVQVCEFMASRDTSVAKHSPGSLLVVIKYSTGVLGIPFPANPAEMTTADSRNNGQPEPQFPAPHHHNGRQRFHRHLAVFPVLQAENDGDVDLGQDNFSALPDRSP